MMPTRHLRKGSQLQITIGPEIHDASDGAKYHLHASYERVRCQNFMKNVEHQKNRIWKVRFLICLP